MALVTHSQLAFLSTWTCNVAYIFVKITFFILYWNIFKPFRWLKLGIIGDAVLMVIGYIAFITADLIGNAPPPGQTWLEASLVLRNNIGDKVS